MTTAIELVPLKCVRCETLIQADEEEVAWICPQCGQGLQLTPAGLSALPVFVAGAWGATDSKNKPARWLPFWVFTAAVNITRRDSYGGIDPRPGLNWKEPRRFYIPAFTASLEQLQTLGAELTKEQPPLTPGQYGRGDRAPTLADCTLPPDEALHVAEFVVLTIEAQRLDKLRQVQFTIENPTPPELWLLPFTGDPAPKTLALA